MNTGLSFTGIHELMKRMALRIPEQKIASLTISCGEELLPVAINIARSANAFPDKVECDGARIAVRQRRQPGWTLVARGAFGVLSEVGE